MSEGTKKLSPKKFPEHTSAAKDRETVLADQFEDMGLVELIHEEPAKNSSGSESLLSEVAEAVEELVFPEKHGHEEREIERVPVDQISRALSKDQTDHFSIEHIETDSTMIIEKDIVPAEEANLIDDPILAIDRSDLREKDTNPNEIAGRLFNLVLSEKSFNDLVEQSLQIYIEGLSAAAGSVLELDSATNEFFFRASIGGGDPEKLKAFRVPNGKGIVGTVAVSGDFLLLSESSADAIQLKAISSSTGFEISSCLAGPIYIRGELYGVIELFNKREGLFTYDDKMKLEQCICFLEKVLEVRFFIAQLFRSIKS